MDEPLAIYADRARHIVTVPYSRDALLAAARLLDISPSWYHRSATHPHVDIPRRRVAEVLADPRVTVVSPREILAITRRGTHRG